MHAFSPGSNMHVWAIINTQQKMYYRQGCIFTLINFIVVAAPLQCDVATDLMYKSDPAVRGYKLC